jgi:hypothetical protein
VGALLMETRADIVGESAARNLPMARISEEVRDHPEKYSGPLLASVRELVVRSAYNDELKLIENTKEWLNFSGCQLSPQQRRLQLDMAFAREASKKHAAN